MPVGFPSRSDRAKLASCLAKLVPIGWVGAQAAQQMRCLGEALRPYDLRRPLAGLSAVATAYAQAMAQLDQTAARIAALRSITATPYAS